MNTQTTKHTVPALRDTPHTVTYTIASSAGKGSDKSLLVVTTFNGIGFADTIFRVIDHDITNDFQKFDRAVEIYNLRP
jgi:hypothetical protein